MPQTPLPWPICRWRQLTRSLSSLSPPRGTSPGQKTSELDIKKAVFKLPKLKVAPAADEEEEEDDEEEDSDEESENEAAAEFEGEEKQAKFSFMKVIRDNKPEEPRAPERRKVVEKVKVMRQIENWELPKISLIEDPPASRVKIDEKEIRRKAELLREKLSHFSVGRPVHR